MIIENSFDQQDHEWFEAKLDSVGGTDISKIITTKGVRSASRGDFLIEKASQIITRKCKQLYPTYEMTWGNEHEDSARSVFEFATDIKLSQCAMIFNDDNRNWHISPDGYNEDMRLGCEIKCPQLKQFMKTVDGQKLPTEHILQVQTSLALTDWGVWWFMSYFPGLKPFIIEVKRNEELIGFIKEEVKLFLDDLNDLINKLLA